MTLTNREKILIVILLFVIIFSGYLYFLIFPTIDSIKENFLILKKEEMNIKQLQNIHIKEKLINKENNTQIKTKNIEDSVPTNENIPELYVHILNISDRAGIEQKEFIIQNTMVQPIDNNIDSKRVGSEELLIIPIEHTFTSTYEGIKCYIEEVYRCERKIDIIEYEISQNKKGELDASFILYSYALINIK